MKGEEVTILLTARQKPPTYNPFLILLEKGTQESQASPVAMEHETS